MEKTNIVVLGGGYAGIETAKVLCRKFRKKKSISITLIDKNTYHTLMTELHEVAGSRVEPDSVMVSYDRIFAGTEINLVTDFITDINFESKEVKSEKQSYPYDYLVLGTGGAPEFFDIPGIQEHSFSLWSLEDSMRIREHFEEQFRLAAKETDIVRKKQMLTFAVAGAGFTGIELAGEFLERRDVLCRKYHIDKSDVKIMIIEALDKILPIIEDNLRIKTINYLEKHGVEILLNTKITGAEEDSVITDSGKKIKTDTFVWTCGIHGSEFTSRINLAKGHTARGECSFASSEGIHGMKGCRFDENERYIVGKRGRLLVNEFMQSDDHDDVYIVGDNMWYLENGKVLPQIVETALQTGKCAAENIAADIENKNKKEFKSNYHGFMVSVGGRYAVSNAGGIKLSGFFAMAMKHVVNLHYLFGLAGLNAVWNYLKHEFFDMKDRRCFLGDHLSWKIQGWWGVPLRAWLGIMWIAEGVNKIGEGWLSFSSGTKSGWMFSPGIVQKGVDAIASASETVTEPADAAADAVSAASGLTETVTPVFAKIWETGNSIIPYDSAFVTWFRETFMDNMMAYISYPFFQTMIVVTEIAIGLALLGGLFTWLAAAASIAMCFVFTFSGMFSWDQAWFVFAAFLMLGGAGRSLGIDHWVMPLIKKWWNSTSIAKRTFLYLNEPVRRNRKTK